jgi:hypothetical protein
VDSPFEGGRCEKIEPAFIQRVPLFSKGGLRGGAGCLFQALIQIGSHPPEVPPLEKGGRSETDDLSGRPRIFSQLRGEEDVYVDHPASSNETSPTG